MADPVHSGSRSFEDIRSFDQRNEWNRGSRIAPTEDTLRTAEINPDRELPDRKVEYPDHQLPEADDARLIRAAEQIGGALGKTVSQVRRVPRSARHGIHLVTDRAQSVAEETVSQLSRKALEIGDMAQAQARGLAERAQQRLRELMDLVEERGGVLLDRAGELGQQMCERSGELKQQLDDRTRELRMNARLRAEQVKMEGERVVRERPLHVIGAIAAAAFVLGISLRIVRSRHACGY